MDQKYDFQKIENELEQMWAHQGIYKYRNGKRGPIFSIDTPPPTVSGKQSLRRNWRQRSVRLPSTTCLLKRLIAGSDRLRISFQKEQLRGRPVFRNAGASQAEAVLPGECQVDCVFQAVIPYGITARKLYFPLCHPFFTADYRTAPPPAHTS